MGRPVQQHVFVWDRAALAEATDLITVYGEMAVLEAASRADKSRSVGNAILFCHWRQIERAIGMLRDEGVNGTIH